MLLCFTSRKKKLSSKLKQKIKIDVEDIFQQSVLHRNNNSMYLLAKYEQLLLICILIVPLFKIKINKYDAYDTIMMHSHFLLKCATPGLLQLMTWRP